MKDLARTPIAATAAELRQKAQNLCPGASKDHLLHEARTIEEMENAREWAEASKLQPPTRLS
jgi:hypothetical protein